MNNYKHLLKIISINTTIFLLLSLVGLNILELFLRKEKPFSLFPKELTGKRTIFLKNKKEFIVTDAKKEISRFEPKTETTYIHNKDGIRSINMKDKYRISNSIYAIGDSTSYGLNINYHQTFTNLLAKRLKLDNTVNLSYPGISLNSIVYKLECLNNILNINKIKSKVTIVSLYHNDIESLEKLPFLSNKCRELKDLNLLNAYVDRNKTNNIVENNQNNIAIFMKKIRYVEKYPYYVNQLICKRLYSQSCNLIKFVLGNINPFFKSNIAGNHLSYSLYKNMSNKNSNQLAINNIQLSEELIKNTKNSEYTILFYIPKNELELISTIKESNLRERIYYLYKDICSNLENNYKNFFCLDGSRVILNSLEDYEISRLLNKKKLPNNYYSYIKMFDMGHPSEYVSNLYSNELRDLID